MTDSNSTDNREQGVDFGELGEKIDAHEYPATSQELIEAYGHYELELQDGTQRFDEVLEPLGDESYESAESVRQAVFNMVGDEAVGRGEYTDRGTSMTGTSEEEDPESL